MHSEETQVDPKDQLVIKERGEIKLLKCVIRSGGKISQLEELESENGRKTKRTTLCIYAII